MKKVLIWDYFPQKNIGGPAGYLFNVHKYLEEHPNSQITFLTDIVKKDYPDVEFQYQQINVRKRRIPFAQIFFQLEKAYEYCIKPFLTIPEDMPRNVDVNQFDFIHIHQADQVSQFAKLYPNYKGKLILTSHCPCPFTIERKDSAASKGSNLYKLLTFFNSLLLYPESRAYDKVNYIMFPCKGARESYEKNPKIKRSFIRNSRKFFYVPSAIMDHQVGNRDIQKLSELGIPDDAFVITYFGRHIPIKGYDILKDVGIKLLEKFPNLYFVCAGEGSVTPPVHQRWKELGFINNVDDLLPQSSLYVLPNRETYFDLITLQILRAGVPLLMSTTGGNKLFLELPASEIKGLVFFDIANIDHLEHLIAKMINLKQTSLEKYQAMGKLNRELFEKYFTLDKYISNYIKCINNLDI